MFSDAVISCIASLTLVVNGLLSAVLPGEACDQRERSRETSPGCWCCMKASGSVGTNAVSSGRRSRIRRVDLATGRTVTVPWSPPLS